MTTGIDGIEGDHEICTKESGEGVIEDIEKKRGKLETGGQIKTNFSYCIIHEEGQQLAGSMVISTKQLGSIAVATEREQENKICNQPSLITKNRKLVIFL